MTTVESVLYEPVYNAADPEHYIERRLLHIVVQHLQPFPRYAPRLLGAFV